MTPPVFRVAAADVPEPGGVAVLAGAEGRHAVTVRRIGPGEVIVLGDGEGLVAECEVEGIEGRDMLRCRVLTRGIEERPTPVVTLVQALPKSERSELAVESATEAGIDRIVPWQSARCVARWAGPKADKGVAKWRNAAAAAAKQARRAWEPAVTDLADTPAVVERARGVVAAGGVVAVLHESAGTSIVDLPLADAEEILLVVGPEGGITDEELAALAAVGARAVVLGPHVLRTSTAAAVALGAVGALTTRWR